MISDLGKALALFTFASEITLKKTGDYDRIRQHIKRYRKWQKKIQ